MAIDVVQGGTYRLTGTNSVSNRTVRSAQQNTTQPANQNAVKAGQSGIQESSVQELQNVENGTYPVQPGNNIQTTGNINENPRTALNSEIGRQETPLPGGSIVNQGINSYNSNPNAQSEIRRVEESDIEAIKDQNASRLQTENSGPGARIVNNFVAGEIQIGGRINLTV